MKILLAAKHWHIFLVSFLVPLLLIVCALWFGKYSSWFYFVPLGIALSQVSLYSWLWAVGTNLSQFIEGKENNSFLFKALIIIPGSILILILTFCMFIAVKISLDVFSMANVFMTSLFFIIPVLFVFQLSLLYCFFFVARLIKQYETKQKPKFEEFFKEFILTLLLPIGIWFLQPKINRIIGPDLK